MMFSILQQLEAANRPPMPDAAVTQREFRRDEVARLLAEEGEAMTVRLIAKTLDMNVDVARKTCEALERNGRVRRVNRGGRAAFEVVR